MTYIISVLFDALFIHLIPIWEKKVIFCVFRVFFSKVAFQELSLPVEKAPIEMACFYQKTDKKMSYDFFWTVFFGIR